MNQRNTAIRRILKINENATLVFSLSFQHGLPNQNFIFHQTIVLYIFYQQFNLCVDWLSIGIVYEYLFENKLSDSM